MKFTIIISILLMSSFFSNAQQSLKLKLNIKGNSTYTYKCQTMIDQKMRTNIYCSLNMRKIGKDIYKSTETLSELEIYDDNNQVFSFNRHLKPDSPIYAIQQFFKEMRIQREYNTNGEVLKNWDIESTLKNTSFTTEINDQLAQLLQLLNQKNNFFYLNKELSIGKQFTVDQTTTNVGWADKKGITIHTTYTVFDINKKTTTITGKSSTEISRYEGASPETLNTESIVMIENSTGLLMYSAEVITFKKNTVVNVVSRDDCKSVDSNVYFGMRKTDFDYLDQKHDSISYLGDDNFFYSNKSEALKAINILTLNTYTEEVKKGNAILCVETLDDYKLLEFNIEEVKCTYKDGETLSYKPKDAQFFFNNNYSKTQQLAQICFSDDYAIEKIKTDIEVSAGVKPEIKTVYQSENLNAIKLPTQDVVITNWTDHKISFSSNCIIKFYTKNNKPIEEGSIKFYMPQFNDIAKLLNIAEDSVTQSQAFLYTIFLKNPTFLYRELTTKEPIEYVEIVYPSQYIKKVKSIETINTTE